MMDGTGSFANTLQRSRGAADVVFRENALDRLYQSGAAKALLPRSHGPAHEIVLVNTAGGITGGDAFCYDCSADASHLLVTTQAAERAYASNTTDIASLNVRLSARNGGAIHWLPQETILFDQSRLARTIDIDLDVSSECLVLESLVFGRHAMGEILTNCHFTDRWRIRRDGRLIHAEAVRLDDNITSLLGTSAGAAGAQMAATLVYVGPRLAQVRADIEASLAGLEVRAALSVWQGRLVLRVLASQTMAGKTGLLRILTAMRGQQVPRVWHS
jgi:urease accessory protein